MTAAKLIEYRITRQLLRRREQSDEQPGSNVWADRLIAILEQESQKSEGSSALGFRVSAHCPMHTATGAPREVQVPGGPSFEADTSYFTSRVATAAA